MDGKAKRKRKVTNTFIYTFIEQWMSPLLMQTRTVCINLTSLKPFFFSTQIMPQVKKSPHSKTVWNTSYEVRESQEAWILISPQNLRDIIISFLKLLGMAKEERRKERGKEGLSEYNIHKYRKSPAAKLKTSTWGLFLLIFLFHGKLGCRNLCGLSSSCLYIHTMYPAFQLC